MWTVNPNIKNGIANKAMRLFTDSHARLWREDQYQQGAKKMNRARKYRTTEEKAQEGRIRATERAHNFTRMWDFFQCQKFRRMDWKLLERDFFQSYQKNKVRESFFWYSWRCSKTLNTLAYKASLAHPATRQ
jgi:hypothetical protein